MTVHLSTPNCLYCIDGWAPDGTHPVLGPVYRNCEHCAATGAYRHCLGCGNTGVFPADYTCRHCLAEDLADRHLTAIFCATCGGITELASIFDPKEIGDDELPF